MKQISKNNKEKKNIERGDPSICNCSDCGFSRLKGPCYYELLQKSNFKINENNLNRVKVNTMNKNTEVRRFSSIRVSCV